MTRNTQKNHGRHAATTRISPTSTPATTPHRTVRRSAIAIAVTAVLAAPVAAGLSSALAAAPTVVSDSFSRTTSAGWGTADSGGVYTTQNSAALRVSSGTGEFSLKKPGTSASSTLRSFSAQDVQTSATFSLTSLPTRGSGVSAALQARSINGTRYEAVLRFTSSNTATLLVRRVDGKSSDTTNIVRELKVATGVMAGKPYTVDFSVTGTSTVKLSARVTAGTAGSGAWQATGTDTSSRRIQTAGSVGIWSYLSQSSTAAVVRVDNLRATQGVGSGTPQKPTPTPTPSPTGSTKPTPTPTPTTTPAPPASTPTTPTQPSSPAQPPKDGVSSAGARGSVGSAAVGTANYPVPANAVFAASSAASGGNGTQSRPYSTVQAAVSAAPSGSTVVVRGGSYHETVTVPGGKKLTIQNYPGEAVWFDGSQSWGGWSASGSAWVSGGYTYDFLASPSFGGGMSDASRYLDPAYPMAAHPDQVFVDGVQQKQVASRAQVTAGTFYVDNGSNQLFLGTNPNGHSVRVSTLQQAMRVQGVGSTVRGIGFQRYAPSAKDMGAVTAQVDNVTLENLTVVDNATIGVYAWGTNDVLKNLTVARNGLLGMGANGAYGLRASGLLVTDNNSEHFKQQPVSGGFKITRSRDIAVTDSAILRNTTNGLWLDESVYAARITGNDIISNGGTGFLAELSAQVIVADNVVSANAAKGIMIYNTSDSQVWNNTVAGNDRNISVMQDDRRQSQPNTAGHDPKRPNPDSTVPWVVQNVSIHNNVVADASGIAQLTVEDSTKQLSGAAMKLDINNNLYTRTSAAAPSRTAIFPVVASSLKSFPSVGDFTAATGQDRSSKGVDGAGALVGSLQLSSALQNQAGSIAQGLPGSIASAVGTSAGAMHLGAWW